MWPANPREVGRNPRSSHEGTQSVRTMQRTLPNPTLALEKSGAEGGIRTRTELKQAKHHKSSQKA